MLKNYLIMAVRNVWKFKGPSLINVFGLALGLTCCILILMFVQHELSYDRYHEKAEQIFRVVGESINPYETFHRARTPNPLAPTLREEFPEIVQSTRLAKYNGVLLESDGRRFYEDRFFVADPSIFEIFTLPFISGDAESALSSPNSLVITESTARKYFGSEDPLDKRFTFENRMTFHVTGVLEDIPANSHFHFDFLASEGSVSEITGRQGWLNNWNNSGFYTYILLDDRSSPERLETKFAGFVDQYVGPVLDEEEVFKLHLQPLASIHHYSNLSGEIETNGDIRYVVIFFGIGLVILVIACVNYVNLATACSASRARELGLRKTLGATRPQLIKQFLSDAIVLSLIAGALAVGLVELLIPGFSNLLGHPAMFRLTADRLGLVVALVFVVGLASGSYPAFFLSRFQPARVVKSASLTGVKAKLSLRGLLVGFQFVVTMVLIACTLTIHQQLSYLRNKKLGFNKEHIVCVPIKDRALRRQYVAMKNELLKDPAISAVSFSSDQPTDVGWHSTARWGDPEANNEFEINHIMVDHDFIQLYEMEVVKGRNFSEDFVTDATGAYILNESAVQSIGWESPLGKKFTLWGRKGEVIGVVKDFHFESLHKKIQPLVFHIRPEWFNLASIRVNAVDLTAALDSIERTWKTFSPNRPLQYFFVDDQFDQLYRTEERLATLSTLFTFIAILIAGLGLFGLASFVVEQRTREIAIRKVLGASVQRVLRLLGSDFLKLLALSALIASPLAYFAITRWLQNFAYRIDLDWWVFGFAVLLTLIAAVAAVGAQVIKVAISNPVNSLRTE